MNCLEQEFCVHRISIEVNEIIFYISCALRFHDASDPSSALRYWKFSHYCVSWSLPDNASMLKNVFSHRLSKCDCLKTYQESCCPQINWLVPLLPLSSRNWWHQFATAPWHWADLQNARAMCFWISIEVCGILTLFLLHVSTTQGTGTFEQRMTSFFESLYHFGGCRNPFFFERKKNFHTTSRPTLDPRMSIVLAWIPSRKYWSFRHPKCNSHHIRCHSTLTWRWSSPWSLLGWCSVSKSCWVSRGMDNDENPGNIVHSNSIAFPSILHCILVRRIQLKLFHLTFPSFHRFWTVLIWPTHKNGISMDTNFCLRALELILISPRMNISGISFSESLQNASLPTFELVSNTLSIYSNFVFL